MNNPYWHPTQKSHAIDFTELKTLCFAAFNLIFASLNVAGYGQEEQEDGKLSCDTSIPNLISLHHSMAEIALSKSLLKISILTRTLDDIMDNLDEWEPYKAIIANSRDSGALGTLSLDGKDRDLSLREACNKIIHAMDFRPVYHNADLPRDSDCTWGMDGTLELEGILHSTQWSATIDVYSFLEAIVTLLQTLEEGQGK